MIEQKMNAGDLYTSTILGEDGSIPWWVRGNPKLAAQRALTSGEIGTIQDAILVDPVGVYCALLPELRRRGMHIDATFSYVSYPDADSKTGYSFAINNARVLPHGVTHEPRARRLSDDEQEKFKEMIANDPYEAIRGAQSELHKRGVIVSSVVLFSNHRKIRTPE
ncbi:hypothetical protein AXA88_26590 [Salmonella enterica]|nr:hypothetical protein [Salmonella enterica]EAX3609386.1 hypothetical protein [Salmonella enterica]EGI6492261.1 hypothetical protein [Salmonella enterica subsp. enterica serovar Hvittingfoss]EGW6282972.1 hypothetical protein [Salmonella enterica]EGX3935386.1 hypothetical protein [Salmonella enterica]